MNNHLTTQTWRRCDGAVTIKDITRLKFQFDEIDVDGSGVIDNHEVIHNLCVSV